MQEGGTLDHPRQHRPERRRRRVTESRGVVMPPQRLADGEDEQQAEHDARQAGGDEGHAPVGVLGDEAAAGLADEGSGRHRQDEDRRRGGAAVAGEVVGQHRGGGRRSGRFPHPDAEAGDHQLGEALGQAAEAGGDRPEEHPDRDDADSPAGLGQAGDRDGQGRVQQGEDQPAQKAKLRIGEAEVALYRLAERGDDLTVDETEHGDQ